MSETYISSRTNDTVVSLAKLKDKKERDLMGLYLCEGYKLCCEASGAVEVKYALLREDRKENDQYLTLCNGSGGQIIVLSQGAFDKITTDKASDGVIFICCKEDNCAIDAKTIENEKICALDCVRDPGNVGTIIRSAAAFGFDRVILWNCADVYNPKTVRATMGAMFKIKTTIADDPYETVEILKSCGRRLIATALSENGMTLGESTIYKTDVPVLGNEGHGVSKDVIDMADSTMIIPMSGKTESLNAAAAAAVILWEYGRLK